MKTFLLLVLLASTDPHLGYTDRELEDMRQTNERWRNLTTETIPGENLDEYIHQLGNALSSSATSKGTRDSERGKIYVALRARLLSIPGHAEYYRDRINDSRAKMEVAKDSPNAAAILGPAVSDMVGEQRWGFKTLRELPSPETVRVLGEFLSDDRGAELSEERREETGQTPNSRYAVSALSKLGLANPPTPPTRTSEDITAGMEAWRHWYAEVKSGRRTFRFIGDPVDYDLRGPSKRGAIEPGPRSGKRSATNPQENSKPSVVPPDKPRYLPYLIAGFFVLAGYLIHRQGRKKAP